MIARRLVIVVLATVFATAVVPVLSAAWFVVSEIWPQAVAMREFLQLAVLAAPFVLPVAVPAGFLSGGWLAWRAPRYTRWWRAFLETLALGALGGLAYAPVNAALGRAPLRELTAGLHVHGAIGAMTAALFGILFGWLLVPRRRKA